MFQQIDTVNSPGTLLLWVCEFEYTKVEPFFLLMIPNTMFCSRNFCNNIYFVEPTSVKFICRKVFEYEFQCQINIDKSKHKSIWIAFGKFAQEKINRFLPNIIFIGQRLQIYQSLHLLTMCFLYDGQKHFCWSKAWKAKSCPCFND